MSKAAIESNTGRHASMVQDAQKLRDQVPAMQRDVQIRADLQNLGQCRFVPVPCYAHLLMQLHLVAEELGQVVAALVES